MPTTRTTATVLSLPRNRTKSPMELMAATLNAFSRINRKAFLAPVQKEWPNMAVTEPKSYVTMATLMKDIYMYRDVRIRCKFINTRQKKCKQNDEIFRYK